MHLQHLIPWSDLVYCLRVDPTEVLLPVGVCGRIHIINKATEIKVSMRNFITDEDICTTKDCILSDELKGYSKNKLSAPLITTILPRRHTKEVNTKLNSFIEKLMKSIIEFADTEDKKHSEEFIKNFKPSTPATVDVNMRCTECYFIPCQYQGQDRCKMFIFWSLFINNQIDHILWLDKEGEIKVVDAFRQFYGGLGNGSKFLILDHLLPFYILTNVIIACGYESNREKWGKHLPSHYCSIFNNIKSDCDFLTFIPSLRPLLDEKIFMQDMTKTKELLKEVFRYIYVYFYLRKKFRTETRYPCSGVVGAETDDSIIVDIKRVLRLNLGFMDLPWWE